MCSLKIENSNCIKNKNKNKLVCISPLQGQLLKAGLVHSDRYQRIILKLLYIILWVIINLKEE